MLRGGRGGTSDKSAKFKSSFGPNCPQPKTVEPALRNAEQRTRYVNKKPTGFHY
jgi:hypothetical protein